MKEKLKKRLLSIILSITMCLGAIPVLPTLQVQAATITGKSTTYQPVYYGPSSGYYNITGYVYADETVIILGKEKGLGWYHILYNAGSNQKSGYVPTSTITNIQNGTPHEEEFYGGYAYSNSAQTVWSCDNPSTAVSIGAINAGEGVTRLYAYGNVMFIEYSTSNNAKRGYVFSPNFSYPVSPTCVGRVTQTSWLSYGHNSNWSFQTVGSVGAGEYVAVLGASTSKGIAYVEYNTNSGRKRGYMSTSALALHGGETFASLPDLYSLIASIWISGNPTIYSGPSDEYYAIDTLSNGLHVYYLAQVNVNGETWTNIIYSQDGNAPFKTGYWRTQ